MAESYISELGDSLSHGVANTNGDRVKIIAPKLYNDGNGNHPSIATALSGKVSKTGDTMTGQLINTKAMADSIKVSHGTANTDASIIAERTDVGVGVRLTVGGGGSNHGIYSSKNSNWIIKADTSANVTINDGKAGTTIYLGNTNVGATNKPMYLASGKISEGSLYAGGTAVTLNGTSKGASTASFYAPTAGGTANYVLIGNGTTSAPTWAEKAPKASAADSATNSTNSAVTADTTHQLYLIGATGSSGQQALKTDTGIYATATSGQLHATTFDVNSKCTLQFNTTTNALDFVFA